MEPMGDGLMDERDGRGVSNGQMLRNKVIEGRKKN